MKYHKAGLAEFSTILLMACGGCRDESIHTVTFDEFVAQVKEASEEGAQDCGIVGIGESELSTNICVASACLGILSYMKTSVLNRAVSCCG